MTVFGDGIDFERYRQLAAMIWASLKAARRGIEVTRELIEEFRQRPEIDEIATNLQNTLPDDTIDRIYRSLDHCEEMFRRTLDGEGRVMCKCAVWEQVRIANGGTLPLPDWEEDFQILCVEA